MRRWSVAVILAFGCLAAGQRIAQAQQPPPPPPPTPAMTATPAPTEEPNPSPSEEPSTSPSPGTSPTPSLPPAGVIPSALTVTITGRPADGAFVQSRIVAALNHAIRPTLASGATITYGDPAPALGPLDAGFQTSYNVPVTIAAAADAPVTGQVAVQVINLSLDPAPPAFLFMDDDPEYIRADGVLFRGTIAAAGNVRIYYYHENQGQPRHFLVMLSAGSTASRVRVIDASAGPNPDVMSVGHAVSRSFITMQPRDEGAVYDIPAGGSEALRDISINPGDGVAGAVDVRVLEGGPLTATVLAIPQDASPATYLTAPKVAEDGHHRHGTFTLENPRQTTVAYTVGGPDASLEYGDWGHAPKNIDPNDRGTDGGEYGVLQQITFDIANPAESPATVYLYESPQGGPVRNSFAVEGTLLEVGCARVSDRYQIASYQIAPRSTMELHVLTMPDGGSNYPLELGMTTTPPQPSVPPISAPNGCFPKPGGGVPQSPSTSAPVAFDAVSNAHVAT